MSFDIAPVGRTPSTAPAATDKTHSTAPTHAAQASDSVTVDTIPSSPWASAASRSTEPSANENPLLNRLPSRPLRVFELEAQTI